MAGWFLLQVALGVAAALVVGEARYRRLAAAAFLAGAFAMPWVAPVDVLVQGALCFLAAVALMKTLQIGMDARAWTWGMRLWHALEPFDVRLARRVPSAFDAGMLVRCVAYAALAQAAVLGLAHAAEFASPARGALRAVLAAALLYGLAEAMAEAVRLAHLMAGIDMPPIHRTPVLARSVSEFWSRRWNRPVNGWLREVVFRPMARSHPPAVALVAAFAASAALHAWLVAPLGASAATMLAAYFLAQGAVVLAEKRLRLAAWMPLAARGWTVAAVVVPLPLLAEPFLGAFGL